MRVTTTGAGLVVTWLAGITVADGGATFARTGTASVTGATWSCIAGGVSTDGVRTPAGVAGDAARATGVSGPSGIGMNVDVGADGAA